MKQKQVYYISVEWFFYKDTFTDQISGPLSDERGLITFETKEEALSYASDRFGDLLHLRNSSYYPSGKYYLSHGEYDRPTIKIKKHRIKNIRSKQENKCS